LSDFKKAKKYIEQDIKKEKSKSKKLKIKRKAHKDKIERLSKPKILKGT